MSAPSPRGSATAPTSAAAGQLRSGAGRAILTAPNLLTLSRLPLAGLVWIAPRDARFVLGLLAAAGLTDVLDGPLARRARARQLARGERVADDAVAGPRSVGAWLDPVCDKVFVLSVLAAVGITRRPPPVLFPLIAARELVQAGALVAYPLRPSARPGELPGEAADLRAAPVGKLTTILQYLAIGAIALGHPATVPLALGAGLSGVNAAIHYLRRVRRSSPRSRRAR